MENSLIGATNYMILHILEDVFKNKTDCLILRVETIDLTNVKNLL